MPGGQLFKDRFRLHQCGLPGVFKAGFVLGRLPRRLDVPGLALVELRHDAARINAKVQLPFLEVAVLERLPFFADSVLGRDEPFTVLSSKVRIQVRGLVFVEPIRPNTAGCH